MLKFFQSVGALIFLLASGCSDVGGEPDPSRPPKGCGYLRSADGQVISLVCGQEARDRGLVCLEGRKEGWAKRYRGAEGC